VCIRPSGQISNLASHVFRCCGLDINEDKSALDLTRVVKFLWLLVDTCRGMFAIPDERWARFQAALRACRWERSVPARLLAKVTGHAVSLRLALGPLAQLHTRRLYFAIQDGVDRYGWKGHVRLTAPLQEELDFWLTRPQGEGVSPIWPRPVAGDVTVFSDASDFGWGGHFGAREARGVLTEAEVALGSSTAWELCAILQVLEAFGPLLTGRRVLVLTDSQCATSIVAKGSRRAHLQALALAIYALAAHLRITLVVRWIPRSLNVGADLLSKIEDFDGWQLSPALFARLEAQWGPHTVDRFASELNTQLPVFNSAFWCPGTAAVDPLQQDWQGSNSWCFPPVPLVGHVLRLAQEQRVDLTLVVPLWPSQFWWPLLCPSGTEFGPFVTGVVWLPHPRVALRPGPRSGRVFGYSAAHWRLVAVRIVFSVAEAVSRRLSCAPPP